VLIRGWLSSSVDDSVLDLAMDNADPTARDLWVAIEGIFHANREPRVIFLLNEFHSMVQGDSTILAYCQRQKIKAAAFRDIGYPVEDSQLVLALLRGLNPRFSNTADDITNSVVLPTFARAHDMLVLKELRLANDEKIVTNTALLTAAGSGCTSLGRCRSTTTTTSSGGHSNNTSGYVVALAADTKAAMAARARAKASGAGMAALPSRAMALLVHSRLVPWVPGSTITCGHPKAPFGSAAGVLALWDPRRTPSCPHGVRTGAASHDLRTALGFPAGSYVEPGWPHRRAQPDESPGSASLGDGLRCFLSHELLGWYTPFPPSFLSFFHYHWQWSNSSYLLSWRVYPSHTRVKFSSS
jgi:hypothetical protein